MFSLLQQSANLANAMANQQLFIKDPMSLMTNDNKDNKSQQPQQMMTSPMQILQSQLGLTPQQLQVLMHHHQQQQQLAFQSVSNRVFQ